MVATNDEVMRIAREIVTDRDYPVLGTDAPMLARALLAMNDENKRLRVEAYDLRRWADAPITSVEIYKGEAARLRTEVAALQSELTLRSGQVVALIASLDGPRPCSGCAVLVGDAWCSNCATSAERDRLRAQVADLKAALSRWEALGNRHDIQPREPNCKCHREIGDSVCPIHPDGES